MRIGRRAAGEWRTSRPPPAAGAFAWRRAWAATRGLPPPPLPRCVQAKERIAKGEVVVEVPDDAVLMSENCELSDLLEGEATQQEEERLTRGRERGGTCKGGSGGEDREARGERREGTGRTLTH